MGAGDLATGRVDERHGRPGVVDEQFLAGNVDLPHRAAQPLPKLDVALAEARAAVGNALRLRSILLPQPLQRDAFAPQLAMDRAEVRHCKLRVDVASRMQARVQCRVIECLRFTMRQPGDCGGGQVVRHRALGDTQRGGDLRVGQRTFVLETENFSNSSHGNPVGWHRRLPEQKGASVPGRRFELPRTATSPPRSRPRFPGIVTAVPTNLTAISDMPAEAVIIRRNHRSTSSDPAVIIRRKPRSRSVGIHSHRMRSSKISRLVSVS